MNYRIIEPHMKGCGALKQVKLAQWDSPWFADRFEFLRRDRLGRPAKRATASQFLIFRCNSTDCPAQMIVSTKGLEKALGLPMK